MTAFSWQHRRKVALEKALYRSIHLCRCNPDYCMQHIAEARLNPTKKVLKEPNIEAKKRIVHEHEIRMKLTTVPSVERPKRLNRSE